MTGTCQRHPSMGQAAAAESGGNRRRSSLWGAGHSSASTGHTSPACRIPGRGRRHRTPCTACCSLPAAAQAVSPAPAPMKPPTPARASACLQSRIRPAPSSSSHKWYGLLKTSLAIKVLDSRRYLCDAQNTHGCECHRRQVEAQHDEEYGDNELQRGRNQGQAALPAQGLDHRCVTMVKSLRNALLRHIGAHRYFLLSSVQTDFPCGAAEKLDLPWRPFS